MREPAQDMKIIDRNKDYYDYLQGIWGQDPKAVYVRSGSKVFSADDRPVFLSKEIPDGVHAWQGELVLTCGFTEHRIYLENSRDRLLIEQFIKRTVERAPDGAPLMLDCSVKTWMRGCPAFYGVHHSNMQAKDEFIRTTVKMLTDKPDPLLRRRYGNGYKSLVHGIPDIRTHYDNPILSSFPLTVIPAGEVFVGIQDFLLNRSEPDTTDRRTDTEKLEAAGFDRKTSFRNIK